MSAGCTCQVLASELDIVCRKESWYYWEAVYLVQKFYNFILCFTGETLCKELGQKDEIEALLELLQVQKISSSVTVVYKRSNYSI